MKNIIVTSILFFTLSSFSWQRGRIKQYYEYCNQIVSVEATKYTHRNTGKVIPFGEYLNDWTTGENVSGIPGVPRRLRAYHREQVIVMFNQEKPSKYGFVRWRKNLK